MTTKKKPAKKGRTHVSYAFESLDAGSVIWVATFETRRKAANWRKFMDVCQGIPCGPIHKITITMPYWQPKKGKA